ncbi:L-pipecolate oxidase 5 [Colletotrichum chlorophyti]|uniref:L-pipecolate oxidase 5 n=1 Tax=Colletotrichum chlorophyti TaxID=708187 RepID=A0A1Q8RLP9_9PEZI|nr:L-pipecolate oxidase 5 [Colletotrichum chlorophyti]
MAKSQPLAASKTFIVVGGGVFGISAILWLRRSYPDCTIKLVDPTQTANPKAASHDISKILRDDYANPIYTPLAIKAMEFWRSHDLFKPFYHQVGLIRADTSNHSEDSRKAQLDLGHETKARWMTPDEVRARWPAFQTANFDGVDRVMFNPNCGWVEADRALEAIRQKVIDEGTELVVGEVKTLVFDANGNCTGLRLAGGDELTGVVLLCTGARTAALLAESAPERTELHAGDRITATGALSFTTCVQGEQKKKFEGIPVLKNRLSNVMGESMSMTPDGTLKFNCDMAFTFNEVHDLTGNTMSLAPTSPAYTEWTAGDGIPERLKTRAYQTLKGLYGDEMEGKKIEKYRICWDATTPKHDFIISPHGRCKNLFIATGGSFHGWKFFPVIGDYIVQMLFGKLEPKFANTWAWDRKAGEQAANPTYATEGDLAKWIHEANARRQ